MVCKFAYISTIKVVRSKKSTILSKWWCTVPFKLSADWVYATLQRNEFFATNSDLLIPISLWSNFVDIWYFKIWILNRSNIKDLHHQVAKIQIYNFKIAAEAHFLSVISTQSHMIFVISISFANCAVCTDLNYWGC